MLGRSIKLELMSVKKFVLVVSIVFVVLLGFSYLMLQLLDPTKSFLAVSVAILVSYLTTLVAYVATFSGLDKKTNTFISYLLTGMVAKMFAGLITIVVVALRFPEVRNEYVAAFMLAYMVFTSFEVYGLIRKLRPISKDL